MKHWALTFSRLLLIVLAISCLIVIISFEENSYDDEGFISKSIAGGLVEWYEEKAIERQINFVLTPSEPEANSHDLDQAKRMRLPCSPTYS